MTDDPSQLRKLKASYPGKRKNERTRGCHLICPHRQWAQLRRPHAKLPAPSNLLSRSWPLGSTVSAAYCLSIQRRLHGNDLLT